MLEVLTNIIMLIVPAVLTWFLAKLKNIAERYILGIEAEVKATACYRSLLGDVIIRLDLTMENLKKQDQKIKKLIAEVELLTEEQINNKR